MTRSRSLGKFPSDPHARERLREAQATEARAVAAVYAAEAGRDKAIARRDEAIAAATAVVDAADADLAAARAALVAVSGVDRAASLLGATRSELRRASAATANGGAAS